MNELLPPLLPRLSDRRVSPLRALMSCRWGAIGALIGLLGAGSAVGCPNDQPRRHATNSAATAAVAPAPLDLALLVGHWAFAIDEPTEPANSPAADGTSDAQPLPPTAPTVPVRVAFQELHLMADGRYVCQTWITGEPPDGEWATVWQPGAVQSRSHDLIGMRLDSDGFWVATLHESVELTVIFEPRHGHATSFRATYTPADPATRRRATLRIDGNPVMNDPAPTTYFAQR